jgi:transcriptional regulator with XRE-family HTH domain
MVTSWPNANEQSNKSTRVKKINELLVESRKKSGLSQIEVSIYLGLTSPQYVSNIERGICAPSMDVVIKLITLYGLNKTQVVNALILDYKESLHLKIGTN